MDAAAAFKDARKLNAWTRLETKGKTPRVHLLTSGLLFHRRFSFFFFFHSRDCVVQDAFARTFRASERREKSYNESEASCVFFQKHLLQGWQKIKYSDHRAQQRRGI